MLALSEAPNSVGAKAPPASPLTKAVKAFNTFSESEKEEFKCFSVPFCERLGGRRPVFDSSHKMDNIFSDPYLKTTVDRISLT